MSQTEDVLLHHLNSLMAQNLDKVMLDYTDRSVLMTPEQSFHGTDEIRAFFQGAVAALPVGTLQALAIVHQDIHEETAYIVWKADPFIKLGTDTFVIRGGKILAQTLLMVM